MRMNRADKMNAINMEMVSDFVECFNRAEKDREVRSVIITGSGKAFSAGADVREMASMSMSDVVRAGHMPLWERMKTFRKPVIAAVNGVAAGGGLELMMACDIAIAAKSARFGQPEIKLGIIPGAGGTQRLTRAVGKQKAMEMVLTGELIDAVQAERYGLILRSVEDERLMDEASAIASKIAENSMFAVELGKEAVNRAFETHLQQGLDFERRNFYLSLLHEDGREGINAFLEKRKAVWKE
jgi:enoyl-CoA hydratase